MKNSSTRVRVGGLQNPSNNGLGDDDFGKPPAKKSRGANLGGHTVTAGQHQPVSETRRRKPAGGQPSGSAQSRPTGTRCIKPENPGDAAICSVCPNLGNTCSMGAGLAFISAAIPQSLLDQLKRADVPQRQHSPGVPQHDIWNGVKKTQRLPKKRKESWIAVRDAFCTMMTAMNHPQGNKVVNEAQFRKFITSLYSYARYCDNQQLLRILPLGLDHTSEITKEEFDRVRNSLPQGDAEEFITALLDTLGVNNPEAHYGLSMMFKNNCCWSVSTLTHQSQSYPVDYRKEYPEESGTWLNAGLDDEPSSGVNSLQNAVDCTMLGFEGQDREPLAKENAETALNQALTRLKEKEKTEIRGDVRKEFIRQVHEQLGSINKWDGKELRECSRGMTIQMQNGLNPTLVMRLNSDRASTDPANQKPQVIPHTRLIEFARVPDSLGLRSDENITERAVYDNEAPESEPKEYIISSLGQNNMFPRDAVDLMNIARGLYQQAKTPVANTVLVKDNDGRMTIASALMHGYTAGSGAEAFSKNAVGVEGIVMDAFLNNTEVDKSRLVLTSEQGGSNEHVPVVYRTDYYCLGVQRNNGIAPMQEAVPVFNQLKKQPCFSNVTDQIIKQGMLQLACITNEMITLVVQQNWSGDLGYKQPLIDELKSRRDSLLIEGREKYGLTAEEWERAAQSFCGVDHDACVAAVVDSKGEVNIPKVEVDDEAVACHGTLRATLCHQGFVFGSGHHINMRCYKDGKGADTWLVQDDQLRDGDQPLGAVTISDYLRRNELAEQVDKKNPDGFRSLTNLLEVRKLALTPSLLLWKLDDGQDELGQEDKVLMDQWREDKEKVSAYQKALVASEQAALWKQKALQQQASFPKKRRPVSRASGPLT